jgi:hypothetical protein
LEVANAAGKTRLFARPQGNESTQNPIPMLNHTQMEGNMRAFVPAFSTASQEPAGNVSNYPVIEMNRGRNLTTGLKSMAKWMS